MSRSYTTPQGQAVRVVGNNILVRADPAPERTRGGIIAPHPDMASAYGTGTVVAFGYLTGSKAPQHTPIPGIAVGDHVLYLRVLGKTDSNPQIARTLEEDVVRVRSSDILLVLDSQDVERVR